MTLKNSSLDSPARLAALAASNLLDTPADEAFDRLTKLATTALRVPVALISIVDKDRQYFKSHCGLPEPWATQRQTPLSHSFCQHVVYTAEPLIVNDAREHAVVRDNLAVHDIGVIAYAGVPIADQAGVVLGSMCAIDTKPRDWSAADIELLRALSAQVTVEMTLRNRSIDLAEDLQRHQQRETHRQSVARLNVHDLRTPLSALVLGLDFIKRVGPITERQDTYLALCKRNTRAVLQMVDDLLDITGIDLHGATTLRRCDCAAKDVVAAAVEQVHSLAAGKSIGLSVDCADDLPGLCVDRDKLVRVMVNLLGNAIKFTPDGGAIAVTVADTPFASARGVQFCVRDNGIGMDDTRRIFEEGVTLDSGNIARPSSGLGLAFCERVVKAHGGRIWVESTPGQGSAFFIRVPTDGAGSIRSA